MAFQFSFQIRPGDIFPNFNCVPKPSWGHLTELKGHLTRFVKGTLGMISIASVTHFFVGLKHLSVHSDHCRAMACRIVGEQ